MLVFLVLRSQDIVRIRVEIPAIKRICLEVRQILSDPLFALLLPEVASLLIGFKQGLLVGTCEIGVFEVQVERLIPMPGFHIKLVQVRDSLMTDFPFVFKHPLKLSFLPQVLYLRDRLMDFKPFFVQLKLFLRLFCFPIEVNRVESIEYFLRGPAGIIEV